MDSSPSSSTAWGSATPSQGNFNGQIVFAAGFGAGGGGRTMSEVPLSGWWLLAPDQAPLKARALCWAMSRFAGWYPNPASLPWVLVKPPQGHTATTLPFPWGSLPRICSLPARQGRTPTKVGTHPWGPPACCSVHGQVLQTPSRFGRRQH